MANIKILSGICALMVLAAGCSEVGISRFATEKPRRLPVKSFPGQVGQWQAGPAVPVDPEVQAKLAGATLLERVYTDGIHPPVDLLLVTSADSDDLHDPNTCFPTQGWQLGNVHQHSLGPYEVTFMTATQGEERLGVLYWMTGDSPPVPHNPWLARIAALRTRLVGRHEGMSLFVRAMATDTPAGRSGLQNFGELIQSPVNDLLASHEPAGSTHN